MKKLAKMKGNRYLIDEILTEITSVFLNILSKSVKEIDK